jgi:23S rRNA-/tRNA-specific pseudouridylate synthase
MRSVPIAVDTNPLDVAFEDADFIAVNKPVGFHTAPIHR